LLLNEIFDGDMAYLAKVWSPHLEILDDHA
jgi:hypothetical protein